MKKTSIIILILFVSLFFYSGCSLDRNNPLDPKGNSNITEPPIVTGLMLQSISSTVLVKWHKAQNIKEYYVYKSMTHNGIYERIAVIPQSVSGDNQDISYIDSNVQIGIHYFYKISAVNEQGLEGRLSDYKGITVRQ